MVSLFVWAQPKTFHKVCIDFIYAKYGELCVGKSDEMKVERTSNEMKRVKVSTVVCDHKGLVNEYDMKGVTEALRGINNIE